MSSNREWMYTMRTNSSGFFNPTFVPYVKHFLDFAFANTTDQQRDPTEGVERRVLGREPTYKEVFLTTHLTKECKERLLAGELNLNIMEGMVFCTNRAKLAYMDYL
ncbi:hypothetical protein L1987_25127 [Smallanthus sonchifolius]|uniref:Uncharacterized protein n=1 Tax=Smallanthus sonchifolius TaxID=185202 RepID=A0ACB9IQ08_9ASTR|nr:hypothetical protein L1987_25127 [Smallanthus sonchifolius]